MPQRNVQTVIFKIVVDNKEAKKKIKETAESFKGLKKTGSDALKALTSTGKALINVFADIGTNAVKDSFDAVHRIF